MTRTPPRDRDGHSHGARVLSGAAPGAKKRAAVLISGRGSNMAALLAAASGEAGIVVGTHALLEEAVQFADLGLVVVDE